VLAAHEHHAPHAVALTHARVVCTRTRNIK
jgi:hypothetical protein